MLRRQAHRRRTMGRRPLIALALALLCVVTVGEAPLARSPPPPVRRAGLGPRGGLAVSCAEAPAPRRARRRPGPRGDARCRRGYMLEGACRLTGACDVAACAVLLPPASAAEGEAAVEEAKPAKTKEQLEAEQEEQLNALRVLYAAQHAVKHANESCGTAPCGGDPMPKFDEAMKNITFPKTLLGGAVLVRASRALPHRTRRQRAPGNVGAHTPHPLHAPRARRLCGAQEGLGLCLCVGVRKRGQGRA